MTEATGIVGDFFALKEGAEADVLAMQMGDFYEFFGEDARLVSEELDLQTSRKSSGGEQYDMAGVPVDELTPYLNALVERGYRVAVADQYEVDGEVEREVTRVVTPGTLLETTDADARFLAAVVGGDGGTGEASDTYGLAFADATTGRFLVTRADDAEAALTELYRFDPVEVLPGPEVRNDDDFLAALRERIDATRTLHESNAFASGAAAHAVREQFGDVLDSLGVDSSAPEVRAAGGAVDYLDATGAGALAAMTRLRTYEGDDHVSLDATTQRNLELLETMSGDGEGSLVDTVDHTVTSAGGRLLREWLARPRRDLAELRRRQDGVAALAEGAMAREELRDLLGDAYDLERLASRATGGRADARDLLQVRDTLGLSPDLREAVERSPALADSPVADLLDDADAAAAEELHADLADALAADPPSTLTEGGLLQRGYDDELDELIERHEELQGWFDSLAERVKRQYSLTHVTVDRNKTDGYYVQVGKSEADGVPDRFEEIKTLKNSKRFTTDELAEKERELLRLEEARGDLEYELFERLRERVAAKAELLQWVGRALAEVDVLASLATHAVENGWTRPELTRDDALEIERGRHPVVEQTTDFVPNDARFGPDRRFLVVTGPNMSGKSTYLRQTALIVLLAQVGSFVPADAARVGLVDGIYTRVGALDELAQGRSTFMVEMQELSNILHSATEDSLVVLDEVGRGTATYDGISIAWAATEYLHNEVGAKTLFATHYHELTTLAEHLERVENVHVAAEERGEDVTFLRTIREGPTDRSYGVHVADLAGVPDPVVDRSREVLDRLREEKAVEARGAGGGETVQAVFDLESGSFRGTASADGAEGAEEPLDPETEHVLSELAETDVNEVPPVELMAKVQEWQERIEDG
ncbi:DNA mismatch repair protein MutS [Halobacteriales archaeon QS_1_68_20]|nr:MAG: DNA mismatch repair protein MutS [Halobacteriales archaeon QS_1_68_20]